jgi:hypothetical protein
LNYFDKSNFFVRKLVIKGLLVEVEFRFYKAIPATADEPESPEEVIIEAVFVDDYDITRLCGSTTMALIEEEILKLYDEGGGA